jgi:hypothetical protein
MGLTFALIRISSPRSKPIDRVAARDREANSTANRRPFIETPFLRRSDVSFEIVQNHESRRDRIS